MAALKLSALVLLTSVVAATGQGGPNDPTLVMQKMTELDGTCEGEYQRLLSSAMQGGGCAPGASRVNCSDGCLNRISTVNMRCYNQQLESSQAAYKPVMLLSPAQFSSPACIDHEQGFFATAQGFGCEDYLYFVRAMAAFPANYGGCMANDGEEAWSNCSSRCAGHLQRFQEECLCREKVDFEDQAYDAPRSVLRAQEVMEWLRTLFPDVCQEHLTCRGKPLEVESGAGSMHALGMLGLATSVAAFVLLQ